MSRAKRFLPKWFLSQIAGLTCTPHHGQGKDHELLWQARRRDPNCNSGGRFAAATVMTTKFVPTRSGDGTFVLEFCRFQYTLFASFFSRSFLKHALAFGACWLCSASFLNRETNSPVATKSTAYLERS